jgi:hypothetical protein
MANPSTSISKVHVAVGVSWATADHRLKESFLKLLKPRLKLVRGCDFYIWDSDQLLVGLNQDQQIRDHLSGKLAILLLSPEFFASDYIKGKELEWVRTPETIRIPVGLSPVPFDRERFDTWGIAKETVFTLNEGELRARFYSRLNTPAQREQFIDSFLRKLIARLEFEHIL